MFVQSFGRLLIDSSNKPLDPDFDTRELIREIRAVRLILLVELLLTPATALFSGVKRLSVGSFELHVVPDSSDLFRRVGLGLTLFGLLGATYTQLPLRLPSLTRFFILMVSVLWVAADILAGNQRPFDTYCSLQIVALLSVVGLMRVLTPTRYASLAFGSIGAYAWFSAAVWRTDLDVWMARLSYMVSIAVFGLWIGIESRKSALKEFGLEADLARERAKRENLLERLLPQALASKIVDGERVVAENRAEASILFIDLVGFTDLASKVLPSDLVNLLDRVFSDFDTLCLTHRVEKIKTNGDGYIVASGVLEPAQDHVARLASFALDAKKVFNARMLDEGRALQARFGMHTGPVTYGVIGLERPVFDVWGDTMNVASRMETESLPNEIQVSDPVFERLRTSFEFIPRGKVHVKGKGELDTYLLIGPTARAGLETARASSSE